MLIFKSKYLRFIINGLLFIFLVLLADQAIGKTLRHYYFKAKSGLGFHLTYSMDSTEADVLIFGSSRAVRHYIPNIIEDSLKMTCFNTGFDGNYLLNSYAIYTSIYSRFKPKLIILDLVPFEVLKWQVGYDQLNRLLPYYKEKEDLRKIVNLKSKFETLKLISEIYPFNSMIYAVFLGNIKSVNIERDKGYIPKVGIMADTTLFTVTEGTSEIDPNKMEALISIANGCEISGIRLILVQSPRYNILRQNYSTSVINEIAKKYGAEFWDYVNDPQFMKSEYYYDKMHLNDVGAHEFSRTIASRIRSEIFPDGI